MRARLWTIFGAGAALGAVGWWMVASGLARARQRVAIPAGVSSDARLRDLCRDRVDGAAACAARPGRMAPRAALRRVALVIALLLLQIYLGALVAGLDAGLVYNTWPLIDGAFVPVGRAAVVHRRRLWRNFFENTLTVQFDHRMVAYAIWLLALLHAADAWRGRPHLRRVRRYRLPAWSRCRPALGIVTLLHRRRLPLALAHQVWRSSCSPSRSCTPSACRIAA